MAWEDEVVLQCTTTLLKEQLKLCLVAEGFGNRLCSLEPTSNAQNVPPDLAICCFVLEQSLLVRVMQEMLANSPETGARATRCMGYRIAWGAASLQQPPGTSSQGRGHWTLLYGYAILLRHSHSGMYLSCLTTSCSVTDKRAFDVGLQKDMASEACWWTMHPASKQRSEGEKVRVGDDLILLSVSSERYLHLSTASGELQADTSFMQTLWNMNPICSGSEEGYAMGGHIMRLFHGHMDECLTTSALEQGEKRSMVNYEGGAVCTHAWSLWHLEPLHISWSGSHLKWGQPFRLRHVTTGRYLALTEDKGLAVVEAAAANICASTFCFHTSKVGDRDRGGPARVSVPVWVPVPILVPVPVKVPVPMSPDTTTPTPPPPPKQEKLEVVAKRDVEGMGTPEIKYGESLCFVQHVASGLWLTYATADTKAMRLGLLKRKEPGQPEWEGQRVPPTHAAHRCRHPEPAGPDRIFPAHPPPPAKLQHEQQQSRLRALRGRQNLFQQEGMITLVLNCIDRLNVYSTAAHFAEFAGKEAATSWKKIVNLLYELLGILEVLYCVLIESPEVLNIIQENHIKSIISLLDKHGRNHKVLDVLCSLCVCNAVAVRSNQNLITENLLPWRDLLLQTGLVNYVTRVSWRASTSTSSSPPSPASPWVSSCSSCWGAAMGVPVLGPPPPPIKVYLGEGPPSTRSLLGPTQALPHTAFTPCPVDTLQIVLPPPPPEHIWEKLVENIHELWALTHIKQGWTYGPNPRTPPISTSRTPQVPPQHPKG
ncbi:ryanodine receptor 1-like [Morphnus guianensis]